MNRARRGSMPGLASHVANIYIPTMDAALPARVALVPPAFFDRDADRVARALIGTTLTFRGAGGRIVETESYDPTDPAAHSYGWRRTPRNATMFGPPGRAYVYRSYGIHWCLNFVCRDASAVLIRALEPVSGVARMRKRRGSDDLRTLCAGPGRLCQALGITGAQDGASLLAPPFAVGERGGAVSVSVGVRIGISKAKDLPRRFGLAGSPFLSRRFAEDEA
jgi:DNA-3-methyladenine glycosylase